MDIEPPQAVRKAQRQVAENFLRRASEAEVSDLQVLRSPEQSAVTIPGVMIRFVALSVLFHLNSARKWHGALKSGIVPQTLLGWLGVRTLEALA